MKELIVILYTTLYRKGGAQFQRVAETMAKELASSENEVICKAIESKQEIREVFRKITEEGNEIDQFHFIGHSGMYGPMYGTVQYPEQFSPFEIEKLEIPFSKDAEAIFHCCRSARWFAPYFARVQKVKTAGYHWYTTFSERKDKYKIPLRSKGNLYCFGCPGKKSHGWMASMKKMLDQMKPEALKSFEPSLEKIDDTYNSVAALYAETFKDIKVRKDEFNWILKHLPDKAISVLDVGCGNGALLNELSDSISSGLGVDVSDQLLEFARDLNKGNDQIKFQKIDGPTLPFQDHSFDLVISLLSYRYLDWDPIMIEIERVLKKDGKLLIVDMVTAPVKVKEWPSLLKGKFLHYMNRFTQPEFHKNLNRLVTDPGWSQMLKYNPIRSQHEMKWYLESRFPGRKVEVINIGMHSRILAFDSKDMNDIKNIELTYP
ncbi:class I SAM-dependent methyltransferase [Ekhidna sp.]